MDSSSHAVEKFLDVYVQVCGGRCYVTEWRLIEPTNLASSVKSKLENTPDGSCFHVVEIDENESGFFFPLPNGFNYPVFLPSPKAGTITDENQELKKEIAVLKEQLALTEAKRLPAFKEFSDASAQTSPSDVALAAVQDALDEAKAAVAVQDAPAPTTAAPAAAAPAAAAEQDVLDEVIAIQVAPASAGAVKSADKSFCLKEAANKLNELCKEIGVLKGKRGGLKKAYEEASQSAKSTRNKYSTLDPKAVTELKKAEAQASLVWIKAEEELVRAEKSAELLRNQVGFWTNMVEVKVPAEQMKLLFNLMFGQEPEALGSFRELQSRISEEAVEIAIPLLMPVFEQRLKSLSLNGVSTPSNPDEEAMLEACVSKEGVILAGNGCFERQEIANALATASNVEGDACFHDAKCSYFANFVNGFGKPCTWKHTKEHYLTVKSAYATAVTKEKKDRGTAICKTTWAKTPCTFQKCFFVHPKILV